MSEKAVEILSRRGEEIINFIQLRTATLGCLAGLKAFQQQQGNGDRAWVKFDKLLGDRIIAQMAKCTVYSDRA